MIYIVTCTSMADSSKIIDKYPILRKYNFEIDYPYPNKTMPRLFVKIDDLVEFARDVDEEIIINSKTYCKEDEGFVTVGIYDDWREL